MSKIIVLAHDYETTGLDVNKDGVVQSCLIVAGIYNNGDAEIVQEFNDLWNPGCPINPKAQAVHGISEEAVADKPNFIEGLTPAYTDILATKFGAGAVNEGAVMATLGYNNRDYDDRIANRCGLPKGFPTIDLYPWGQKLKTQGLIKSAKLVDVYKYFTGHELVGAHDASADVKACLEILADVMRTFGFTDILQFFTACNSTVEDPEMLMPYGKHRGKTLRTMWLEDPDYVSWILDDTYGHNRDVVDTLRAMEKGLV